MSAVDKKNMVTDAQNRYLHTLYGALCWEKDQYSEILHDNFGVDSTLELTRDQANDFILELRLILKIDSVYVITYKQISFIRQLWHGVDYSNGLNGDVHLNAFIKKRFLKERLEDLSKTEATKLISMVRAMQKQAKAREGKTVVLKRATVCVFCGSKIMWVQLKSGERVAFDIDDSVAEAASELLAKNFHACKNG